MTLSKSCAASSFRFREAKTLAASACESRITATPTPAVRSISAGSRPTVASRPRVRGAVAKKRPAAAPATSGAAWPARSCRRINAQGRGAARFSRSGCACRSRGALPLHSTKPVSSSPRRPARPIICSNSCGSISCSSWLNR